MVKSKSEAKKKKPAVAKTEFALDMADATAVYLVGDFNQWGTAEVKMKKDKQGIWRAKVQLEPGIHQYKFLVDGRWIEDPSNPETTGDPFGGRNSVITVG
ncbi:MAG: glycogen-binding domain-containing protein [Acidobacteriota bacterium]